MDVCEIVRETEGKDLPHHVPAGLEHREDRDCTVTIGNHHLRTSDIPGDFEIRQLTGEYR